jgi:hypothetical protein
MIFGAVQDLVVLVLWVLFGVVKIWALVDCARRPTHAFTAVGRLNKTFWLIIVGVAALTALLPALTLGLIGIAGLVAALVYLFGVRPRIIEITGR